MTAGADHQAVNSNGKILREFHHASFFSVKVPGGIQGMGRVLLMTA